LGNIWSKVLVLWEDNIKTYLRQRGFEGMLFISVAVYYYDADEPILLV
jgi:hypothetical protein